MSKVLTSDLSTNQNIPDAEKPSPLVIFTIGVTGAGKTTWSRKMENTYPTLDIAIIETPEASVRNASAWREQVASSIQKHDAIILDGKHLDVLQLRQDVEWLRSLGVHDFALKYFSPESLFVLLARNGGMGGAQIRDELQRIRSDEDYLKIVDAN